MNYQETAQKIVSLIGGKENVAHLEHCSTRLRFTLNDDSKVNIEKLEKVDGVIGVRQNVQCQVIIGNDVIEVYNEVRKLLGDAMHSDGPKKKQKLSAVFLDFVISVFQPLVPAIAGGGVLKSVLMLAALVGIIDNQSSTYLILDLIGTAPLYFLPILVAATTANKLKVNQLVAMSAVGALLLPKMAELLAEGTSFMTLNVTNIDYSSQVFPAILTVLLYAQMEKLFTKYSPKAVRIFLVPMLSLVVTVPLALLILGPLGYQVGSVFADVIIGLYDYLGWIIAGLLGAILPFMVVTGMHKPMIPYVITSLSKLGFEPLYLPASLAHNIAESGACFAVGFKTKDARLKSTAISAGISALFGITEPALYGVTILHKRVLYGVMLTSFIGGSLAGLVGLKAFAAAGPGLASITLFTDSANTMNLVWAFVILVVSFVVAFLLVFVLYNDKKEMITEASSNLQRERTKLETPVSGQIMDLSEVNDDVFSSGLVGEGIGVIPDKGIVIAPEAGEISMVFDTKHAVGMKLADGTEVLLHVGIDTVKMNGNGFKAFVKTGDTVEKGQKLIEFNIKTIKEAGYDPTVICLITNSEQSTKYF
uniref:beta-glucoside-specific PTS transporter subunit IIABC n=1 Tax=Candidatus Enterococcus willemsii TaxID=1857215 RepID=UPI00403F157E